MKKLLAILLAILMVFTLSVATLTGCKQTPPDNSGGVQTPGEEPGEEPGQQPGEEPGEEPGDEPGNEPGQQPGDEPSQTGGNKPGNPQKEDSFEAN